MLNSHPRSWAMNLIDNECYWNHTLAWFYAGVGHLGRKEMPGSMGKVTVMLPVWFGGCCGPPWTLASQVERSKKGSKDEGAMATT
jgi:hypothetical protein